MTEFIFGYILGTFTWKLWRLYRVRQDDNYTGRRPR